MARKTKYNDDFPLLAEDYARKGMIDKDIARKFGISQETFYQYVKKYPEFSDALKRGKAPVDVEVENALLKRARGYEYEETTVEYRPGKEGEEKASPVSIRKTKKQVLPDTTAQIFWLKNRRSKDWKDKQDIEVTNKQEDAVIESLKLLFKEVGVLNVDEFVTQFKKLSGGNGKGETKLLVAAGK